MKNEKGFTLIEMLIVLSIIAVLIILIVPSLANKNKDVQATGCEALQQTVQAQVSAYELEHSKTPSNISDLLSQGFITEKQTTCHNGETLVINDGIVNVE